MLMFLEAGVSAIVWMTLKYSLGRLAVEICNNRISINLRISEEIRGKYLT
jgi:hypothetical protein